MSEYFGNGYTEIWAHNFHYEVKNLLSVYKKFPIVAVDTEFPGDPYGSDKKWYLQGRTQKAYDVIKRNVDPTNLITLGL